MPWCFWTGWNEWWLSISWTQPMIAAFWLRAGYHCQLRYPKWYPARKSRKALGGLIYFNHLLGGLILGRPYIGGNTVFTIPCFNSIFTSLRLWMQSYFSSLLQICSQRAPQHPVPEFSTQLSICQHEGWAESMEPSVNPFATPLPGWAPHITVHWHGK